MLTVPPCSIEVSLAIDMSDSTICSQLGIISNDDHMPIVTDCPQGTRGRYIRLAKEEAFLDIAEIEVTVPDPGE